MKFLIGWLAVSVCMVFYSWMNSFGGGEFGHDDIERIKRQKTEVAPWRCRVREYFENGTCEGEFILGESLPFYLIFGGSVNGLVIWKSPIEIIFDKTHRREIFTPTSSAEWGSEIRSNRTLGGKLGDDFESIEYNDVLDLSWNSDEVLTGKISTTLKYPGLAVNFERPDGVEWFKFKTTTGRFSATFTLKHVTRDAFISKNIADAQKAHEDGKRYRRERWMETLSGLIGLFSLGLSVVILSIKSISRLVAS